MGEKQFLSTVGGTGGTLSTSTTGTVETDNYDEGGGFDSSAYPLVVNPAETIQEFSVTRSPSGGVVDITTTSGTTFTLVLDGATGAWDKWSIDSLTFRDPAVTGQETSGGWAGE